MTMTREEAIKTLRELWRETNDTWYEEVYNMAIEALSADAVQGWIPCSKRLPENTAEWKAYITCNKAGNITTTYWADGWNCWRNPDGEINREYEIKNIVAWMPLPTPYKGGDDK